MKKVNLSKFVSLMLTVLLVLSVIPITVSAELSTDANLIAKYDFDDATVTDSSGNGKNGTIQGNLIQSANGVLNAAAEFNGSTTVTLPNNILTGLSATTVSTWVNPNYTPNWSRVWDLGSADNNYLVLMARADANIRAEIRIGGGTARAVNIPALPDNVWSHVVVTVTRSGNSGTLTLYVNGQSRGSISNSNINLANMGNTSRNYIGKSQFSADAPFKGFIDDFRIYDKALTVDEIREVMAEGAGSLVDGELAAMDLATYNDLANMDHIVDDFSLPSDSFFANYNYTLSWESSNTDVVKNNGEVIALPKGSAPVQVTMTAKLTNNFSGEEKTKDFLVTVEPIDSAIIIDALDIKTVPGQKPVLPEKIKVNEGTMSLSVIWDSIAPYKYASEGTYEITGTVKATGQKVKTDMVVSGFANPIIPPGSGTGGTADPWVVFKDGWYYFCKSDNDRSVVVAKAQRLQDLGSADRVTVFTPTDTNYNRELWAPEMHYVQGKWYIYYAADNGNNANHRMLVAEGTTQDPQDPFISKGRIAPTKEVDGEWVIDPAQDKWGIDGTVIQNPDGKLYYVWSGWEGDVNVSQITYIAEMLNPWTLKGSRVEISRPEYDWEKHGDPLINEGPQIIHRNGKVYIIYSASGSWTNYYCLGMLRADETADLLLKSSWYKHDQPLFEQSPDPTYRAFSTGHASMTVSPDGTEDWLVYHAYQVSGGGWSDRSARAQKFTFDGDMPNFGTPVAYGEAIESPSGMENLYVSKYQAEDAVLTSASIVDRTRASGDKAVLLNSNTSSVEFTVNAKYAGKYALNIMGNAISSGTPVQGVSVNGVDQTNVEYTRYENNVWTPARRVGAERRGEGLTVDLSVGENKIVISRVSLNTELDYIALVEQERTPEPDIISIDNPASAAPGEEFTLEIKTKNTNSINLYNENGLGIIALAKSSTTDDETGITTWTVKIKITSAGLGKKITVKGIGDGKTTGSKDTSIDIKVPGVEIPDPEIFTVVPDKADGYKTNENIELTITTTTTVKVLKITNESGAGLAKKSTTVEEIDGKKVWKIVTAISTKGNRKINVSCSSDGVEYGGAKEITLTISK